RGRRAARHIARTYRGAAAIAGSGKPRSSRVQLDGSVKPFELIRLGLAIRQVGSRALINGLCYQYLAGCRYRLCTRRGIDHGADRSQITMRATELAERELSRMNANADAEVGAKMVERFGKLRVLRVATLLDFSRREYCLSCVI